MGHVIVLSQTTSEIHLHQLTPQRITTKTDSTRIGTATITTKEAHLWISHKTKKKHNLECMLIMCFGGCFIHNFGCGFADLKIVDVWALILASQSFFLIKKVHLFHYFHCSPNSKTTSDQTISIWISSSSFLLSFSILNSDYTQI